MKVWAVSLPPRGSKFGVDMWKSIAYEKTYNLRLWGFGKGCMIHFKYG